MSESEEVGERGRKRECGCVEAVGTVKVWEQRRRCRRYSEIWPEEDGGVPPLSEPNSAFSVTTTKSLHEYAV